MADLSKLAIGVRTFLRDEKLFKCLDGITQTMPEVKIIVADCGYTSNEKEHIGSELISQGHTIIDLPFDAGFGAMSNAIINALDRPLLLMGSDDFSFGSSGVREGIERMVDVLEHN